MFIFLFVRFKRISQSFNEINDRIHLSDINDRINEMIHLSDINVYKKTKLFTFSIVTVNVLTFVLSLNFFSSCLIFMIKIMHLLLSMFCFILNVYILNIELIIVDVVWVWFSAVDDVVCRNTSFYIQYLVSGNICFCFNARRLG